MGLRYLIESLLHLYNAIKLLMDFEKGKVNSSPFKFSINLKTHLNFFYLLDFSLRYSS